MNKKMIITIFLVMLTASSTLASAIIVKNKELTSTLNFGDKEDSIDTPGEGATGLTYDGTYLWNADAIDHKIYKLDKQGQVTSSFVSPVEEVPGGLAWDGEHLWHSDPINKEIIKMNTSGNVIVRFDTMKYLPDYSPTGMAFNDGYLWVSFAPTEGQVDVKGKIMKIDTDDGTVIESIESPGEGPSGLTFVGEFLYHADNAVESDKIYKMDVTGDIKKEVLSPGSGPWGLTYDGEYLWNVDTYDCKIYKIKLGEGTTKTRPYFKLAEIFQYFNTKILQLFNPDFLKIYFKTNFFIFSDYLQQ
jgi:sugar lactone lactonase YvrE